MNAAEAMQAAAMAALREVAGLGLFDGPPVQGVYPYAEVEIGPESDWSHKSGAGREMRIAAIVRDGGERPDRLRRLMNEVEASLAAVEGAVGDGWRVVNMRFQRARTVKDRKGWAGLVEFRVRLLSEG